MKTNTYYRIDDYGKPCPRKTFLMKNPTQVLPGGYYDYDTKVYFFRTKKTFKAYDSKYFRFVFDRLPMVQYKAFNDIVLKPEDLEFLGIDDDLI